MDTDKLKGLKSFFGGNKDDNDSDSTKDEEYYNKTKEEYHVETGMAGSKMMLLEPRAYSESQQIADYLKGRNSVVVNLKRVTPDVAKRIVDFLYGTIYAINGDIKKLGGGIFLCTPNNVNVEGNIADEQPPAKKGTSSTKKDDKEDEDEFF